MNFHKANELWVNTAVISSSFPLRRECWVSQGQKGTNCLTVKESHRKTLLFFCFLKGPLWREEQAIAVRFTTCRDAECQRISAWLSWAGQDIGDWVLTYPQVKMMVGASFGETNGSGPPCWYQATGKGMSQGSTLHQGCRPPTLIITGGNPLRRLEEQVCVWWQIFQGDGKNLESSNKIPQSNQLASQPTNTKVSKSHHVRSRHSESPNWSMYSGSLHKWDFCSFGGLWVSEA